MPERLKDQSSIEPSLRRELIRDMLIAFLERDGGLRAIATQLNPSRKGGMIFKNSLIVIMDSNGKITGIDFPATPDDLSAQPLPSPSRP